MLITFLLAYFLVKLPFNLSVLCANENEGFSFNYGQNFLDGNKPTPGRGFLFILAYVIILKIFGFNTYSIIAVHFIQTLIVFLISIIIYLIMKIVIRNDVFSALTVLFWLLFICTPIGQLGQVVEILSHYTLEPEYFIVLFSLLSIFYLLLSFHINEKELLGKRLSYFLSLLAGVFSLLSFTFKASGAIIALAIICWFVYLLVFFRKEFDFFLVRILFYFTGIIFSFVFLNCVLYFISGDLVAYWREYFLIGGYASEEKNLLNQIFQFMTRNTSSVSNFLLFLFGFLFFFYGLVKCIFQRGNQNYFNLFWPLTSIWGIGSTCAVITPGMYQSYYYHLVWPPLAIVIAMGLYDLHLNFRKTNYRIITFFTLFLFLVYFSHRISITIPAYYKMTSELLNVSIFSQPQSFQDPVQQYSLNKTNRPGYLQICDFINVLLPDKKSTFYILNFNKPGASGLTPLSYIYAKRPPPTSIDSSLIKVNTIIEKKFQVLKDELTRRPPDILIVGKHFYFDVEQQKYMRTSLPWLDNFIRTNYVYETDN